MANDAKFTITRRDEIRDGYATIAQGGCCGPQGATSGCCGPALVPDALAKDIGYADGDLASVPDGANLGLSCGNPTAIAELQPGEVVVDLGSGAGFDCFIAGPKVGATGRVIGVDMTHEMLAKARENTAAYRERSGLDNVEFRLGEIEHLPLADASVDVILSNCVLNLSTDKAQVWSEIARVLKPGGRVMASDMALFQELPPAVAESVTSWVGCVGGSITIDAYREQIEVSGLTVETLDPKPEYVATLTAGGDPFYAMVQDGLGEGETPDQYITSIDVLARRPAAVRSCC